MMLYVNTQQKIPIKKIYIYIYSHNNIPTLYGTNNSTLDIEMDPGARYVAIFT